MPTAPATRPAARPTATSAADRHAPAQREARWAQGLVRASGGLGRGTVPRLDGHVSLGVGLRSAELRAELVAFHVLAQAARYPELPTVGAEVAAWGGSLRAGPVFEHGAIELSVAGGVSAAALVASGFGVRDPDRATSAWIALCFVPGLRWRPGPRWAVGADLEGEVALRRPAFALDALPAVHRTGRVGVRGAIVVEIRLGPRAR